MGVLDKFERGVENVVHGVLNKTLKADLKPVEVVASMRREMDNRVATVASGRRVVPNVYTVTMSPADQGHIEHWGTDALVEELVAACVDHATRSGYSFVGAVSIMFVSDPELLKGRFIVSSESERGAVAPATGNKPSKRHPLLEIEDERYMLTGRRAVIGRGGQSDIILDDTGVSRCHLELTIGPDDVTAKDLSSTNGTYVEGHRIDVATLLDRNTIRVGNTLIRFLNGESAID